MKDRLLREPEVAKVTGLGRTTRFQLERKGLFPRRRKITKNTVGWLESELLEWILSRGVRGQTSPEPPLPTATGTTSNAAPSGALVGEHREGATAGRSMKSKEGTN
jgi:prophage regulatory protein